MQTYDILMLVVLVVATVFGLWKGVAWQIAALASMVVSYLVAIQFADQLAPYLSSETPWNRFLAMLVLYLATSLAIWLMFRMVSGLIERVKLKEFDRQVGALFGVVTGVILCTAITFFAVTLSEQARDMVLASRSGFYLSQFLSQAEAVMPKGLHEVLDPYLERLDKELESTHTPRPAGG